MSYHSKVDEAAARGMRAKVLHMADGGVVKPSPFSLRGLANSVSDGAAAVAKPFSKPAGYVSAAQAPTVAVPAASAATPQLGGVNLGVMQRREAAAGLRDGGTVKGPGTQTSDSIPARLSKDEYVLPADTALAIGHDNLDDLVDQTHTPADEQAKSEGLRSVGGERDSLDRPSHDRGVRNLGLRSGGSERPEVAHFRDGGPVWSEEARTFQDARSANQGPQRPYVAPAPVPSLRNPMNWADAAGDASRRLGTATGEAAKFVGQNVGGAAKAAVSGLAKYPNAALGAIASTAGHGNAYSDDNIPTSDKLRIFGTDAVAMAGAGTGGFLGGAAGAGAGTAVLPVAGTIAGGLAGGVAGGTYGERLGRKAGNFLFGGDEAQRRGGYDPERGLMDIAKDGMRDGVSDKLFGVSSLSVPATRTDAQRGGAAEAAPGVPSVAPTSAGLRTDVQRGGGNVPALPAPNLGTDIGSGMRRIDGGSSPLFTNVEGADNDRLMGRRPTSAQNQLAMDGIQARQDAGDQARAGQAQFNQEVADAAATNAAGGFGTGAPVKGGLRGQLEAQLAGKRLTAKGAEMALRLDEVDAGRENNRMTNTVSMRNNDQNNDVRARGDQLQARTANAKAIQDQKNSDRTYLREVAKDGEATASRRFEMRQKAGKDLGDEIAGMLPPIMVDGKPTADTATAARYMAGITAQLGAMTADLEQKAAKGDATAAKRLALIEEKGPGVLDAKDKARILAGMQAADQAQASSTPWYIPWGGTAVNDPRPITSLRKDPNSGVGGFFQEYVSDRGDRIPARDVEKKNGMRNRAFEPLGVK